MYKRNIQRLTQTYLTLSLQDIADTVQLNSPKEAELHVLQMVATSCHFLYHCKLFILDLGFSFSKDLLVLVMAIFVLVAS